MSTSSRATKKTPTLWNTNCKTPASATPIRRGMQVQISTATTSSYSLLFTADPEVYDANKNNFLALVKSFELAK